MPYSMREENGRFCVYKRDSRLKCYDEKQAALDYLAALESHADEKQSSDGHYRALGEALTQVLKYGRVLSRANEEEITSALTALITVLRRAGIELEGEPMDAKSLIERLEEKAVDPETAQIVADVINQMVQEIDTQLGITEVLQGQQEQPVDEDGNPIEEDPNAEEQPPDGEQPPPEDEQQQEETDSEGNPKKKPPYKKSKMTVRHTQEEVNYTPDYAGSEHCASCRWFTASGYETIGPYCHIIENGPADILPTGRCDRWESLPTYEPEPLQVEVVGTAALEGELVDVVPDAHDKNTVYATLKTQAQKISDLFKRTEKQIPEGNFQVFKGADNRYYWLARHTNMFEDRDKEILSSSAHKRYISRIELGLVDKPELWMWHTKGTRHGQADYVWEHAGFVFALGHFDDTPEGKRAVKFYQRLTRPDGSRGIELSHGFTYPSWALKDGVYETYNTFEISTLPPGAAANPYTRFEEIEVMALNDKTRAFIAEGLGQDVVERIERAQTAAEKDAQTLIAEDKRYKDFADAITEKDGQVSVDLKQVLKTIVSIIDAQGELEALVTKATEEATAQKSARETLEQKVAILEAQLKLRPRSASRAKETEIEGENALSEAIKQATADKTINPFWRTEVEDN